MRTRLLAAAVGLAVLLPAVVFGGVLAIEIIAGLAAIACVAEYGAMAFPGDRVSLGATFVAFVGLYGATTYGTAEGALGVAAILPMASLVWFTFRPGPALASGELERAADSAGRLVLGVGWLAGLSALVWLRREPDGLAWVFLVLVASWLGDTGGYFAGRAFGRRPLYPRVSPKKTWEGALGGITLATVGTFVVSQVGLPSLSVVDCLILGPLLCIAGIVGDLSESLLKRSFGVKDSGWIMPGHGGLLDRIDSVLFVGPCLLLWVRLVEG